MKFKGRIATIASALIAISASANTNVGVAPTDLVLSGPVEAVDISSSAITVLGHRVNTADAARVVFGQMVNVYGVVGKDGTIEDAVVESSSIYVPGADVVYIKGVVSDSNSALGTLKVGSTNVDYTAMLGASGFQTPTIGSEVSLSGIQPTSGGVVLARPALSGGGGQRSELSGGGGQRNALSGGGGQRSELSGGGGQRNALSGGGGQRSELSGGGGQRS